MKKKNKKKDAFEQLSNNRNYRQVVARESHLMFFHMYFPHYVKYEMAEFQREIFRITEDRDNELACIVSFRNSAKSTLVTLSYSLWSILGIQGKKFVLIICQTQAQAKQHMANIRSELESNRVLKSDLGPFKEETGGEWAMSSLVFKNTGARIMIASLDQSIRGIRHLQYRPDLIILDDIEDLNSTRTIEGRNKTFDWFTREIIPLGDTGTRTIIVSNLLHEDCLVMRLRRKMENKEIQGIFRWFPLITDEGKCLWPGKFKTLEDIEKLRQKVANELAWQQEYLLKIISDSTKVIWPEWIQYYDKITERLNRLAGIHVGVDLAISQKETADYTAMVSLKFYSSEGKTKIYVLSNPINKRMTFPETINTMTALNNSLKAEGVTPKFNIESNGFQEIYVETLGRTGCKVDGVKQLSDKRSRLALTSNLIKEGVIVFPKQGAEELVSQLTGFGVENKDDLADAFALAVIATAQQIKINDQFEVWAILYGVKKDD